MDTMDAVVVVLTVLAVATAATRVKTMQSSYGEATCKVQNTKLMT